MTRQLLDENSIHPAIRDRIGGSHADTLQEVSAAIADNPVVVVGMAQNPYCKKVRKQLDNAGIAFKYLEYGSYTKQWQRRLVLKMWSGWPSFPMVFVKGQLVGGNQDVQALLESGQFQMLLHGVA
jgi:glutaredoxin-related protein